MYLALPYKEMNTSHVCYTYMMKKCETVDRCKYMED